MNWYLSTPESYMASPSTTDESSPKRQATSAPSSAVGALDTAIWTSIIELVPVHADSADETATEAAATLQTLLSLRLVSKELAELIHPTKSTVLWQKLLLLTLDFSTTGKTWNIENYQDDHDVRRSSAISGSADPQQLAIEGRWSTMPGNMLDEDLILWDKLGIYHRPSQYGFLTKLQQDPRPELWPMTEDPSSLFYDLLQLLLLPEGDAMGAGGEGGDSLLKCLVAPSHQK